MSFVDKTLKCRDCGNDFIFTAGEQEFYQQKGLQNLPGRCPSCRANRRNAAGNQTQRAERTPRELFTTVCAECGNTAQVPFSPRLDKPVYCSSCYEKARAR